MVAIVASSSLFQVVTYIDVSVLCYRFPIVIDTFPFEIFRSRYPVIPDSFSRPTFPFPFPFPAKKYRSGNG